MVKMIADYFKGRELESNVLNGVVEPSGRHLIRGGSVWTQVACGQRKQGLGNGKNKRLYIYPPIALKCLVPPNPRSESYQPV